MRNREKHLLYYNLVSALGEARDCALCELESNYMHHYFETLLYENVNDPVLRDKLAKSGGFCHRHAHLLLSFNDALGMAILYRDQISILCRYLKKIKNISPKSLHEKIQNQSSGNCPACTSEEQNRNNKIETFLEWIDDDELKRQFESGVGFCKEHLFAVIKQAKKPKTCSYIIEAHFEKYSRLLFELDEFIRKNDYKFVKEEFGKEGNSWLRAIKMLVGGKDNF